MQSYVSMEMIRKTTNRLPFTEEDLRMFIQYAKGAEKKGRVVRLHPMMKAENWEDGLQSWFDAGLVLVWCPQIDSDILFVKCNNGRGLFGGQRVRFSNYLGSAEDDEFLVGGSHKMFVVGLTGISNIFRARGL